MPSVANSSPKMNGFSNGLTGDVMDETLTTKMANKKLDMIIQDQEQQNSNGHARQSTEEFHDTRSLGAHSVSREANQDDEPIVIFDTQSNTSIAQTAKDQFAAALLRLQSGLDESTNRLNELETKVDDIVRQQRQQVRANQERSAATKNKGWLSFAPENRFETFFYLSWPVLVFVAMRALEKRALLKRLD